MMKSVPAICNILFIGFYCAVMAFPVLAENEADIEVYQLEKMVITASKRATTVENIPAGTTVLDANFLNNFKVNTTEDAVRFVPNLYFKKSAAGNAFVIRGLSTIDTALVSPVGLYVNDVAYPLSYMQSQLLFNVERIEVLRGPQSTLYGKNSSSGVINVVLPVPDNELYAGAKLEYSTDNTFFTGLSARGPVIKDKLYLGLTSAYKGSDGYIKNITTGDDAVDDQNLALRGTLRLTPADDLDISLTLDGNNRLTGLGFMRLENGAYATDYNTISCDVDDEADQGSLGQSLRVIYSPSDVDITSITAHRHFTWDQVYDFDRTPVSLGDSTIEMKENSWSEELRINNATGSRLEWLAGLHTETEDMENNWALNHQLATMANQRDTDTDFESIAAFGQITYHITEQWSLSGGQRLDTYEASGSQTYTTVAETTSYSYDLSETEWLPMASIRYAFTDEIEGYMTYSTGWLGGGYNYYTATSEETFTYDPEYTRNYEIGVKTLFWGTRLFANFSMFYTEIDDKQIMQEVSGGGVTARKYTNAAEAHSTGVELELKALPMQELELFAGLGYTLTKIDDWSGTSYNYNDNQVPWAPDLTANIGAEYTWKIGLYLRGDVSWTGETYFDAANTLKDNGYVLANIQAGYQFDNYDISVWCKNLFDEEYSTKKTYNTSNLTLVEEGDPLTVGITLTWRM